MEQWLQTTFSQYGDGVLIYQDNNTVTVYDPINASSDFAPIATTPPTYAQLSVLSIAFQGWQKIFDQWKQNKIIS